MNQNDVIVQSKITLARNVKKYPFPTKMHDNRAAMIAGGVLDAVNKNGDYQLYSMAQISPENAAKLREKGLISDRLMNLSHYGSAIINSDESVSIMINEEDHVVEQCVLDGLSLEDAFVKINAIDDEIALKQEFCYHPRLGYLTSCPTNVGTGMHASVRLFLPALTVTKSLNQCLGAVNRLNMSVRSVYDESVGAYLYSITNQKTLGLSEKEIIDLVTTAANHLAESELRARKMLKIASEPEIKDKAMRSYGILKNSYKMSAAEMMGLVAWAKIGEYYGYFTLNVEQLERTAAQLGPSTIGSGDRELKTALEKDIYRAEKLRNALI